MSTVYFIVQQMLFFAIPLLIVSLGGLFTEKSGVTNIALEGIMIIGAFAGVITINLLTDVIPGQLLIFIAIAVSGIAGGLYSLLHAWASIRLKADQTISGTALNIFAPAFCIYISRALLGTKIVSFADTFHIDSVPVLGDIPVIGPLFFKNCYLSTYFGIILFVITAFVFKKTRFGLRLSACGDNPEAAASAGIPVARMRYFGTMLSGILAGIGGIIFIIPTSTSFASTVAGYGFLALAVLILGQWNPVKVMIASFFFGLLKALSSAYSGIPFLAELGIPSEIYKMVPYVLTLLVLAVSSENVKSPKSLGKIYDDGNKALGGKKKLIRTAVIAVAVITSVVITAVFPSGAENKNAVSPGYGAQVALIIDETGSVDDDSYVQCCWEGISKLADENGLTKKYYQSEDNSKESLKKCIDLAIKGNAETVFVSTNMFEEVVAEEQWMYPDILFMLMDMEPKDSKTGEVSYAPNVVSICFKEEQAGFLAGYAAVKDGMRKLGYIGGMAVPSVVKYGYGYITGAEYAAKELGLKPGEVELKYNYAGTFSPNPESQAMASAWFHSGTEVIFACAGGMGDSVIKAAENTGGYVIEPDNDKSNASETVLTSAMKEIGKSFEYVLEKLENGEQVTGKQIVVSAAEGCVNLPMETSRFRTFSQQDYQIIYDKLAAGEIDVPNNTAVSSAKDLPLEYLKLNYIE